MATVAEMLVRVGANVSDFEKKIGGVQKRTADLGKRFGDVGGSMTKFVTGPMVAVAGAFVGLTLNVANNADEIAKNAREVGLTAEEFQKLRFATDQAGVGQETFQRSVGAVNKLMGEAIQGNEKAIESFDDLGVEFKNTDGSLRDTNDVFTDAIQALSEIEEESVRSARASELFGDKAGRELATLMEAGAEGIKEAGERAEEFGIISNEATQQAEQFNDNMDDFKRAVGGAFNELGTKLLPQLVELVPLVQDKIVPAIQNFVDRIVTLIDWFLELSPQMQKFVGIGLLVLASIGPLLLIFGKLFGAISSIIGVVKLLVPIIGGISLPVIAVIAGIVALIAIGFLLVKNWETIKEFAISIFGTIRDFFAEVIASVIEFFTNLRDTSVETWSNMINKISDVVRNFVNGVVERVTALRDGIVQRFTNIRDRAVAIFNAIRDRIIERITRVRDNLINLVTGIRDGIISRFTTLRDRVSGIFNGVLSNFRGFRNGAVGIFDAIREKIVGTFDGIKNRIKGIINAMIRTLNSGINRLNRFGFRIPQKIGIFPIPFIGGMSIGLNIPNIPQLQEGGIIRRETLALVGEGGPEAVIPLDQLSALGGVVINVAQLIVREEADIEKIAERLFRLQQNKLRARGVGG